MNRKKEIFTVKRVFVVGNEAVTRYIANENGTPTLFENVDMACNARMEYMCEVREKEIDNAESGKTSWKNIRDRIGKFSVHSQSGEVVGAVL